MPTITTNFPVDLTIVAKRNSGSAYFVDRLRGSTALVSQTNAAETNTPGFSTNPISFASNISWATTSGDTAGDWITLNLRRAPGFFDVVCYTGTGTSFGGTLLPHNLGAFPELMIAKARDVTSDWHGWYLRTSDGGVFPVYVNSSAASPYTYTGYNLSVWATSTVFDPAYLGIASSWQMNTNGTKYVVYLFRSCPGVSKVGSYTGNGSSQTINCGFTGGVRFVLIKRTDSTGDWYVWDTSRGIVAGNDPHLSLNSTTAEVTTNDSIDTDSTGFIVNQLAATNINVSSATYIFLAIA
jgi:hypothetical protein